jgi:hypothetical protein
MSEPTRWRETGPEEVRALLQHAVVPRPMNAAERSRMARRVARLAAIPAGLGVLFWVKGVALGAVIGAISLTAAVSLQKGWVGGRHDAAPVPVHPVHLAAPAVPTASSNATPEVSSKEILSAAASSAFPLVPSVPSTASAEADASPDARVDTLAEEATLLEQARAAIGANPARALELTEQHASRYPRGQLGIEREIVAIEALKGLGRSGEARARADALLSRARGSLYEDRIRNLFPGAPASSSAR